MRVLIYSDVHANAEALAAMAAAAAGRYDASLCLGDVVGYGANPNEAAAWVREHTPVVIRGNHDRACASLDGIEWFNPSAAAAARWTHATLAADHTAWLASLPAGPVRWQGECLVHGSPMDEDEYLMEAVQAAGAFAATAATCVWFGHTHVQGGFALVQTGGETQLEAIHGAGDAHHPAAVPASRRMALAPGARYLINPGSVGQPRDGDWRAAYALLNAEEAWVEFHRVPYDIEAAQRRILEAGLPMKLAQRLAQGR
jgi:diadenosine tetraphosphatase ApaH/serine/threonine PP2A family protein phosphatase